MTFVNLIEVDLYYEQVGRGEPIVLTHGAWTDGRTWEAVIERLTDRFMVVSWDRRGHSRSGVGVGRGSTREDAADLAALIEYLGAAPAHVVGSSAGGNVVLNLITARPDLVASAAVHEPGPFGLLKEGGDPDLMKVVEDEMTKTHHVEGLIAEGRHREAARYFVDNIAVGAGAWDRFPEELRQVMESNAATVPDDLRDGWDIGSVDLERLAASSGPLSISTGTESPELESAAAYELARRVPAASLESVQGSGHIPHRTHPETYAAMLISFIEKHSSDVAATAARSQR